MAVLCLFRALQRVDRSSRRRYRLWMEGLTGCPSGGPPWEVLLGASDGRYYASWEPPGSPPRGGPPPVDGTPPVGGPLSGAAGGGRRMAGLERLDRMLAHAQKRLRVQALECLRASERVIFVLLLSAS